MPSEKGQQDIFQLRSTMEWPPKDIFIAGFVSQRIHGCLLEDNWVTETQPKTPFILVSGRQFSHWHQLPAALDK